MHQLTPSELERALELLFHADRNNVQLGWTILETVPQQLVAYAPALFLVKTLHRDRVLRQAIEHYLQQHLSDDQLRTWEEGLQLLTSKKLQDEDPDQSGYFPALWAYFEQVEADFLPYLGQYDFYKKVYLSAARRLQHVLKGHYEYAAQLYEQVLAVYPQDDRSLFDLAALYFYEIDGQEAKAEALYVRLQQLDPQDWRPLEQLGHLYFKRYGQPEQALVYYRQLLAHDPNNEYWKQLCADLQLYYVDQAAEALPYYQERAARSQQVWDRFSLAEAYAYTQDWAACHALLDQLTAHASPLQHHHFRLLRARVLALQGDWEGAQALYRALLEAEPQDAGALGHLAWIEHVHQARYHRAAEQYRLALAVYQTAHPHFSRWLAHLLHTRLGDAEAARAHYMAWKALPAMERLLRPLEPELEPSWDSLVAYWEGLEW